MRDWIWIPFVIFVLCTTMGWADSPNRALERQAEVKLERKLHHLQRRARMAEVEDLAELQEWAADIRSQLHTLSISIRHRFAASLHRVENRINGLRARLAEEMK